MVAGLVSWDREVHDLNTQTNMETKLVGFMLGLLLSYLVSTRAENFSAEELNRRASERLPVKPVIWGMPAVNYDPMLQQMRTKTPGRLNEATYWGKPLD